MYINEISAKEPQEQSNTLRCVGIRYPGGRRGGRWDSKYDNSHDVRTRGQLAMARCE